MELGTTCVIAWLKGLEVLSRLQNIQSGSGAPPSLLFDGYRRASLGKSGRGIKLTAQLYLTSRFRMNGAISLRPVYAFVVKAGKTLPFHFIYFAA
jgi:hypothetical protein